MRRIKVLHHSNQLSIGGTEKTIEIFCKYLSREIFDVFVAYNRNNNNERLPNFIKILGEERLIGYGDKDDFINSLNKLNVDILHVHRMGTPEFPENGIDVNVPIYIETNIFGGRDDNEKIHKTLFVSQWLKNQCDWAHGDRYSVMPNPIELPYHNQDMRDDLNLHGKIVIGRVGRPDNSIYDDIIIKSLVNLKDDNTVFMPLAPPPKMMEDLKKLKINTVPIDPTVDNYYMSLYYNTIDILAHARLDGETFGCNIAEAMMHGKPVVSHLSHKFNAHAEIISHAADGYIAGIENHKKYYSYLKKLVYNDKRRKKFGEKAREKVKNYFEAGKVTEELAVIYIDLFKRTIGSS